MTNEELILKFYDGDETILEKLYNKNIGFCDGYPEITFKLRIFLIPKHIVIHSQW